MISIVLVSISYHVFVDKEQVCYFNEGLHPNDHHFGKFTEILLILVIAADPERGPGVRTPFYVPKMIFIKSSPPQFHT